MKKKSKVILTAILIGILVFAFGAAGIWYLNGYRQYAGVFLPGTYINGQDVSDMTPEEVETAMRDAVLSKSITILEKNEMSEEISFADVVDEITIGTPASSFLDENERKRWPFAVNEIREYEDPVTVTFADAKISAQVGMLAAVAGEDIVQPEDAYFTKTDAGFAVIPEEEGTLLDVDMTVAAVADALRAGDDSVDLAEAGCYAQAKVLQDDPKFAPMLEEAEKIQNMVVTMDMTAATETIDFSVFGAWVDWDGNAFVWDEEAMAAYIEELGKKYRTYQSQRNFVTHDGGTIIVGGSGGDTYGFWMNVEETTELFKQTLYTWEPQSIYPVWRVNALTRNKENGDIGGTYIEVSIEEQHLWYYKDYELAYEMDVVTGKDSDEKRRTPTGVFCILNKLRDHTMSGTYGSQFCHYFMVFDWTGCALHDASWRSSFGGDIYKHDGSHGCVNCPPSKIRELFDMVYTATPVIVY